MLTSLQVETIDEDIALMNDILRLPDSHSLQNSSSDAHDGLATASSEHVLDGVTEIRTQPESERDETEHFIKKNKSTYKNTVQQYYAMLTVTERDLIYTAYYQDYLLFDYEPNL